MLSKPRDPTIYRFGTYEEKKSQLNLEMTKKDITKRIEKCLGTSTPLKTP